MSENLTFKIGPSTYEMVRGEVISVSYKDDDIEQKDLITVRILSGGMGSFSSNDVLRARPYSLLNRHIPVLGEIVFLVKGPSPYNSAFKSQSGIYYLPPISIQNNTNHNALFNIGGVQTSKSSVSTKSMLDSSNGIIKKSSDNEKEIFSDSFKKDKNINSLQPFAGDHIIEGRFGHSIRFGSTIENGDAYSIPENWNKANGKENDPILIIANGRTKEKPFGKYTIEEIDNDNASIYFTSSQKLNFKLFSNTFSSIRNQSINTFENEAYKFSGTQLALFSKGRIILNTQDKEIIMMSGGGIGFSSKKSFSFDTEKNFEIGNARRINLGLNANEPALLGNETEKWLKDLLSTLSSLCIELTKEIHPTPTGPSGPPSNSAQYIKISGELKKLSASIPKIKSKLVFLNKDPK